MKYIKRLVAGSLVVVLSLLMIPATYSHDAFYDVSDAEAYVYPVLPGTEEWLALPDHSARLQACQIPEDVFAGMSTKDLAASVLDYPFLGDLYAFNTARGWFQCLTDNFNGLQELRKRPDAGTVLLGFFNAAKVYTVGECENMDEVARFDEALKLDALTVFLTQPEFVSQLSSKEQQSLSALTAKKREQRAQNPEFYSMILVDTLLGMD